LDVAALRRHGVAVYPGEDLPSRRMAHTLAALGPRPVIELHTAGLKVGEIGVAMEMGKTVDKRFSGLVQTIAEDRKAGSDISGKSFRRHYR